jgi:hypothetical protein
MIPSHNGKANFEVNCEKSCKVCQETSESLSVFVLNQTMNLFAGFSKEPAKETVMKETKAMITQKNRTKIDFMLEPKE